MTRKAPYKGGGARGKTRKSGKAKSKAGSEPAGCAARSARCHRAEGDPSWASAIGQDRYGRWVEITIPPITGNPVTQRLRWIEPGTFLMGSPETEPERYQDEGPQHEVTISKGFWLFDTACPQALWQAVMGENPSSFKSPDRPVEMVSWEDVQTFLKRQGSRMKDCDPLRGPARKTPRPAKPRFDWTASNWSERIPV